MPRVPALRLVPTPPPTPPPRVNALQEHEPSHAACQSSDVPTIDIDSGLEGERDADASTSELEHARAEVAVAPKRMPAAPPAARAARTPKPPATPPPAAK